MNSLDIVLQDFFYLHSALRITRGPEKHGVPENTDDKLIGTFKNYIDSKHLHTIEELL